MKKFLPVLALLWGLPAYSQGMPVDTQGAACIASATAPAFTQGNWGALSCDLAGGLRVSGGGGGGGGGGTVTQGPAATDTAANRWPVLAYQGGPWAMTVTSGTVTANIGTTNGLALDATLTARFGTLGQKNSAGSAPVVISSDQSAVPVSGVVNALTIGTYNATPPTTASGGQVGTQSSANGSQFVDLSRSPSQPLPTGAATETTLASLKGATDNAVTSYTVTATGTQTGVQTTSYGSVLVEMTGTFTGVIAQVEGSTNTTNGIDGTWTALAGLNPEDIATPPTTTLLSGAAGRRKLYRAQDGVWIRLNVTSFGTGTAVINLVRRTAPIAERISYVSNTVNAVENVTANAGGLTTVSRIVASTASTHATSAKASAGRLYKITGFNAASSIRWLKFYNTAAAPTPGTTTVFFQLPLPPGAYSFDAQDLGYYFGTGVGYAVTTGAADADATAVTAGDILNQNIWVQ